MPTFLKSLETLWSSGELRDMEQDLDCFIRSNLSDLRRTVREGRLGGQDLARRRHHQGALSKRQFVDFCVRSVLRRKGSCNPGRDIEDQRREIEKEVWFEGERARRAVPRERQEEIARNWARLHAPHWREWRLFQLLYVWERKADDYLRLIGEE
jgi:hypothetical protein